MHKYYDSRMLHLMRLEEMKTEYAPKEADGILLSRLEAEALKPEEKLRQAVDVTTPAHFIAAGFDVNFVAPDDEAAGVEPEVSENAFRHWLESMEFHFGSFGGGLVGAIALDGKRRCGVGEGCGPGDRL